VLITWANQGRRQEQLWPSTHRKTTTHNTPKERKSLTCFLSLVPLCLLRLLPPYYNWPDPIITFFLYKLSCIYTFSIWLTAKFLLFKSVPKETKIWGRRRLFWWRPDVLLSHAEALMAWFTGTSKSIESGRFRKDWLITLLPKKGFFLAQVRPLSSSSLEVDVGQLVHSGRYYRRNSFMGLWLEGITLLKVPTLLRAAVRVN